MTTLSVRGIASLAKFKIDLLGPAKGASLRIFAQAEQNRCAARNAADSRSGAQAFRWLWGVQSGPTLETTVD